MKAKILLVDDEPDVLDILSKRLEEEGFLTVRASDGNEGLRLTQEEKPDLVLLDVMMPNKDGFSMLRDLRLQEELRSIPVIMLSAKGGMDFLLESQRMGAMDYMIKPIDFAELLKYIHKYILWSNSIK